MIKREVGGYLYYDKNGSQITAGCQIKYPSGEVKTAYLTSENELGTDATNPEWIRSGRAVPCEYGIYPLTLSETDEVEVVG